MKERPILFSGEMVRAILDGRKTQTRRIVFKNKFLNIFEAYKNTTEIIMRPEGWWAGDSCPIGPVKCPYGKPGDKLWVRETWCGNFDADGDIDCDKVCAYKADTNKTHKYSFLFGRECGEYVGHTGWKSPIFMSRWASRILLEITDIRVERVQDITWQDAKAEGIIAPTPYGYPRHKEGFEKLWDSINKKRRYGWAVNPWVWALKFKRF